MVLSKAQKNEDTLVKTYEQGMKNLITTETKLNGAMMKGIASYTKWVSQLSASNKISTDKLKIARIDEKKSKEQLVVKEKLKKADEHLIKLRHKLNIEQEREHGDQVRRNINLRHNMDSFNDKFEMLKKSLTGGFGFQAAIGTTIKKMGSLTRSYQEFEIAQDKYDEALNKATSSARAIAFANTKLDKDKAKDEHKLNLDALERTFQTREGAREQAEPTLGKVKPVFEKLGKLGEFLGKKAVPIGLGVGVAGVIMSVIVKAFSASPLFAQMMKLMKFMVTLILMPIGTFFGALLRPILILLLRKFIVPMYSQFMPMALKVGGQIGKWLSSGDAIDPHDPSTENIASGNFSVGEGLAWLINEIKKGNNPLVPDPVMAEEQENKGTSQIPDEDPLKPENLPTGDPNNNQSFYDRFMEGAKNTMITGGVLGGGSTTNILDGVTGATGEFLTKDDYNNPIVKASNKILEQNKEEIRIEKRDRAMNQMNALMDQYRTTGGIIEDTMPKFGQREQLWNEVYNKGGDIKNAGANIAAANARNASAGYTMGGSAKSQSILEAYNAFKNGVSAANGFDGMVNSPTMFLAGEAGSEHVTVTPNGQGGGSNITINIQNMNGSDNDLRKLKKTILEVIQESSANRGRL